MCISYLILLDFSKASLIWAQKILQNVKYFVQGVIKMGSQYGWLRT